MNHDELNKENNNKAENSTETECDDSYTDSNNIKTDSSSEYDYEISNLNEDDLDQVILFNKNAKIYDDVYEVSKLFTEKFICARSGEYILNFAGFIEYEIIRKYLPKKLKKAINKFCKEKSFKILICEKYFNTPYKFIVSCLEKLEIPPENFLFISKCKLIKGDELEEASQIFYEYKNNDIKYFPNKPEEIFVINNNVGLKICNLNDEFFRICLMNKDNLKDYIDCIKKDLNQ